MKYLALIIWMFFTVVLACSVVGLFLLMPQQNYTSYHKSHLSEADYFSAAKKWKKILSNDTIEVFIRDILKGKQLEFKELY